MTKKNTLSLVALVICCLLSYEAVTYGSGAPGGNTGSPADSRTCANSSCHSGPAVSTESVSITTDIPPSGFAPNTNYTITITADDGGRNLSTIGFEATVEESGVAVGNISENSNEMMTVKGGDAVTHTSVGTAASGGSRSWSFTWNSGTAPDQSTVYTAVNFTNNNGSNSGDVIVTESLTLTADQGMSVFEEAATAWSLFPNPAYELLIVQEVPHEAQISVFNLEGKLLKRINTGQRTGSTVELEVGFLPEGTYVLHVEGAGSRTFIISR